MSTDAPMIIADGLEKRFGSTRALAGLDLQVARGSALGLLGRNGAGKTTLVRILATLMVPDAGRAWIGGRDVVAEAPRVRALIGLAGQSAAVDETLSGRENLELVGRLYGLRPHEARARAGEVLERLTLSQAADRLVRTYSGGMRRRLDLGASLVGRPAVLIMDEPTTGLDPRTRIELWRLIEELVGEGTTLLLTTQYLEEADRLADRIAVIDRGRVVAEGTPDQLKRRIGGDVLEVRAQRPSDVERLVALMQGLGAAPAVADLRSQRVTLPTTERVSTLLAAARQIERAGIAVDDLGVRRPSLDDVFLALTTRPDADQAVAEGSAVAGAVPAAPVAAVAAAPRARRRRRAGSFALAGGAAAALFIGAAGAAIELGGAERAHLAAPQDPAAVAPAPARHGVDRRGGAAARPVHRSVPTRGAAGSPSAVTRRVESPSPLAPPPAIASEDVRLSRPWPRAAGRPAPVGHVLHRIPGGPHRPAPGLDPRRSAAPERKASPPLRKGIEPGPAPAPAPIAPAPVAPPAPAPIAPPDPAPIAPPAPAPIAPIAPAPIALPAPAPIPAPSLASLPPGPIPPVNWSMALPDPSQMPQLGPAVPMPQLPSQSPQQATVTAPTLVPGPPPDPDSTPAPDLAPSPPQASDEAQPSDGNGHHHESHHHDGDHDGHE